MLNPNTYVTLQAWFITDLHLKGNELTAFSIIYGFTQDGRSAFNGSLNYLMEWLGCSKPTIIKTLGALIEKGLITKIPGERPGVDSNRYKVNFYTIDKLRGGGKETLPGVVKNFNRGSKETLPGVVKNFNRGSKETLPNNYINTDIDNYKDKESVKTPSPAPRFDYQVIKELYNNTCISYSKITAMSDSRKKLIKSRAEQYDLDTIKQVFDNAERSDFLKGKNARGWKANFDWLMNDANFAKVLDGNYNNTQRPDTIPPADDLLLKGINNVPIFGGGLAMGPNGVLIDKTADNTDLPWDIGG